ncbi:hypothetical protein ACLOJK_011032 [Asimina triloba]
MGTPCTVRRWSTEHQYGAPSSSPIQQPPLTAAASAHAASSDAPVVMSGTVQQQARTRHNPDADPRSHRLHPSRRSQHLQRPIHPPSSPSAAAADAHHVGQPRSGAHDPASQRPDLAMPRSRHRQHAAPQRHPVAPSSSDPKIDASSLRHHSQRPPSPTAAHEPPDLHHAQMMAKDDLMPPSPAAAPDLASSVQSKPAPAFDPDLVAPASDPSLPSRTHRRPRLATDQHRPSSIGSSPSITPTSYRTASLPTTAQATLPSAHQFCYYKRGHPGEEKDTETREKATEGEKREQRRWGGRKLWRHEQARAG